MQNLATLQQQQTVQRQILQFLVFQVGWLVCVIGGDTLALVYAVAASILHAWFFKATAREWFFILIVATTGSAADYLLFGFGVLLFDGELRLGIPLWLVCLWWLFASTFNHGLSWLQNRVGVAIALAAVFAPLSYWSGAELSRWQKNLFPWSQIDVGIISLSNSPLKSCAVIAFLWILLFPGFLWLAKTMRIVERQFGKDA